MQGKLLKSLYYTLLIKANVEEIAKAIGEPPSASNLPYLKLSYKKGELIWGMGQEFGENEVLTITLEDNPYTNKQNLLIHSITKGFEKGPFLRVETWLGFDSVYDFIDHLMIKTPGAALVVKSELKRISKDLSSAEELLQLIGAI